MPMYVFQFNARPMPAHPKGNQYQGAFVTCWIQRDSQIEAETVARRMIADQLWMILGLKASFLVTKETQDSKGMEYFEQAEIDGEVLVIDTWPVRPDLY